MTEFLNILSLNLSLPKLQFELEILVLVLQLIFSSWLANSLIRRYLDKLVIFSVRQTHMIGLTSTSMT